jgi:hypothetical protein
LNRQCFQLQYSRKFALERAFRYNQVCSKKISADKFTSNATIPIIAFGQDGHECRAAWAIRHGGPE